MGLVIRLTISADVVAEDTSPNITINPAFELAYWRYGLGLAETWMTRLALPIPSAWTQVKAQLAPLPIEDGLYAVYDGIESNFWTDPTYINDHPALAGIHGWLPPIDGVNLSIAKATADKTYTNWNISNCWGYDCLFMLLARYAWLTLFVLDGTSPCSPCPLLGMAKQSRR
jgi:hypothetical protein